VEYHNRKRASVYLNEKGYPIGTNRLAQLATTGEGPPFRYWGRYTIYTEPDLDAWAESRFRTPVPKPGSARAPSSADELAVIGHNKEPPLSPPTRQARRHRKRSANPKADQNELST
jgi:hypothetical protein